MAIKLPQVKPLKQDGSLEYVWYRFFEDINIKIGGSNNRWQIGSIPVYANNAAAIAGGLKAGEIYRNGADPDHVCIVH